MGINGNGPRLRRHRRPCQRELSNRWKPGQTSQAHNEKRSNPPRQHRPMPHTRIPGPILRRPAPLRRHNPLGKIKPRTASQTALWKSRSASSPADGASSSSGTCSRAHADSANCSVRYAESRRRCSHPICVQWPIAGWSREPSTPRSRPGSNTPSRSWA